MFDFKAAWSKTIKEIFDILKSLTFWGSLILTVISGLSILQSKSENGELWRMISTNFLSVTVIVAGILFVVKLITNKTIDTHFNKQLESYKSELAQITEREKFSLQRKLQDFGLFTNKRHTVYPEVYKLILIAQGRVLGLTGYQRTFDFNGYDRTDVESILTRRNVASGIKSQILNELDSGRREDAKQLFDRICRNGDIHDAFDALNEAQNVLLISQLYIAEDIVVLANQVLKDLRTVLTIIEFPSTDAVAVRSDRVEREALEDGIKHNLDEIRKLMRKELAIADYDYLL